MQTQQQSNMGSKLPIEEVINEYQAHVSDLIKDNVYLRVYVGQLEKQVEFLNQQLEQATTTVTHTNNNDAI